MILINKWNGNMLWFNEFEIPQSQHFTSVSDFVLSIMDSSVDTTSIIVDEAINATKQLFALTNEPTGNENEPISWATIGSILYFSLYVLLVIILSIYIHTTENYDNKKAFLKAVWARKGIYGQILVHLYDTATDIGVLIQWGTLAYDENDYESIDMHVMFWTSIGFLIFYRFVSILAITLVPYHLCSDAAPMAF